MQFGDTTRIYPPSNDKLCKIRSLLLGDYMVYGILFKYMKNKWYSDGHSIK